MNRAKWMVIMWRLRFTGRKGSVDQEGVLPRLIRATMACSLEEPSGTPGSAESRPNGVKNIKVFGLLGIAEHDMTY